MSKIVTLIATLLSRSAGSWDDTLRWRCRVALWCAVAMLVGPPACSMAQTVWEYSPYQVVVIMAVEPSPLLPISLAERWREDVRLQLRTAQRYAWDVTIQPAVGALTTDIVTERVDYLAALRDKTQSIRPDADKLFSLCVSERAGRYLVRAQEWDVRTRTAGMPVELSAVELNRVTELCLASLNQAFRPLAKIERVDNRDITARVRASGLIDPTSSLTLQPNDLLVPVIRRNQRNGEPVPNGISAPDWTYLQVQSVENTIVKTQLQTGLAGPIPVKGGARLERYALRIILPFDRTVLQVRSRVEARVNTMKPTRLRQESRPLANYEIFSKSPTEEHSQLVGLTDWQGKIELPRGTSPLQLFYIRNGGQFLARLPIAIGQQETVTLEVLDDDPRLQVESIVRGVQSRVLDLTARREVIAARTRRKIESREFAGARQLVKELRALPQRTQLSRELDDQKSAFNDATGVNAKRIDKLFRDGQKLLATYLDPGLPDSLEKEIAKAEAAPPEASPKSEDQAEAATASEGEKKSES